MNELTIVTSCHGYGQYLAEWADSIIRQEQRPGAVRLFTHGSDADAGHAINAARALREAGLDAEAWHDDHLLDFGTARNRAVEMAETEWVMHLDADDMLMPHAVREIARLAPNADVVSLGYERCGDLAAGPQFRRKTYRAHRGQATLDDGTPASGVSPFRRSFWERSPYRTDMLGGWDTALWIGFAHLDARFVPTPGPCFWYRQHADSVFNARRKGGWKAAVVGRQLQRLRRRDSGVAIVVPRARHDGPERAAAWGWLRSRLTRLYPDWPILEGVCPRPEWNKGRAVAAALEDCRAAVLVILDADCVLPAAALTEAVALVESGAPWVVPHRMVHRLSAAATATWLTLDPGDDSPIPVGAVARSPYEGYPGGGALVVPRVVYEAAGGIPVQFGGWGCEDEALAVILDTLAGAHRRLEHDLVHLWHPPQSNRRSSEYRVNRGLLQTFLAASNDPAQMFNLVSGGAVPTRDPYFSATWRYRTQQARGAAIREEVMANRGVTFTMRKLADQHERNQAKLKQREAEQRQRQAAAAAFKAGQAERAARRRGGVKQDTAPYANKMESAPYATKPAAPPPASVVEDENETDPGSELALLTIDFASPMAENIAREAGLRDADFAGVEPEGSTGYTAAQVRTLLP